MTTDIIAGAHGMTAPNPRPGNETALREVARDLEAAFLAEMLKHAGFGESRESFGGGIGEEQMSSLLRAEHANALAAQGGIGLAESIYQSMLRQSGAAQ